MKPLKFYYLAFSIIFVFFLSSSVLTQNQPFNLGQIPVRSYEVNLGHLVVNPSMLDISEPTYVEYTLRLKEEMDGLKMPIFVFLADLDGKIKGQAVRLFDDGTHGDETPNDNIYTGGKKFDMNKPVHYLSIAVTFISGELYLSNAFPFDVVKPISEESFQATLALYEASSDSADIWLEAYPLIEAQNKILEFLNTNDQVTWAVMSDDDVTITALDTNGVVFIVSTAPPGALGRPGGNQSLCATPLIYDPEPGYVEGAKYESWCKKYLEKTLYDPFLLLDSQVTIEELEKLYNYSIISFFTHAGQYKWWGQPGTWIQTGEKANWTCQTGSIFSAKKILGTNGCYAITDRFITELDKEFPNSLVFISGCNTFSDNTMASAFLNNGASTYIGWEREVSAKAGAEAKKDLLAYMVDEQKTVSEAYNSLPYHIDPWPKDNPPAELKMITNDPNLVIYTPQPYFEWAVRAGGLNYDSGYSITIDSQGNSIVTGYYKGAITFGTQTFTSDGWEWEDIFIAKYNTSGELLWAKSIGGSGQDIGYSITTDKMDNIVVTGCFNGTVNFGKTELTSYGYSDIFIAKYDPFCNELWAKHAGDWKSDYGLGITIDESNNIIITGRFTGNATFDEITLTSSGAMNVFVAKYDAYGNVLWAKSAGGTSLNFSSEKIDSDGYGDIFITGHFEGYSNFGSVTLASVGEYDIFVAKYDAYGNLLWAKSAGGTSFDQGMGISADGTGSCLVTGYFRDTATFGTKSLTVESGYVNMFIVKYDPMGFVIWAKQAYGSTFGRSIITDGSGNSYITGDFAGTATFDTKTLVSSNWNVFIARYNPSGRAIWAKQGGGSENNVGLGISKDNYENIVITGNFYGISTFDTHTITSMGGSDIFVVKLIDPLLTASASNNINLEKINISKPSKKIPNEFNLVNNYPNPFNPETNINFSLPEAGQVSLVVYDLLGRKMKTLFTGNKQAGDHTLIWDGTNNLGQNVASGIYIYRIEVKNENGKEFVANKKMILMR